MGNWIRNWHEDRMDKKEPDRKLFKRKSIRGSIREKNSSGRYYVRYLEKLVKEYPPNTIFKVPGIGDDVFNYRYFFFPAKNKKEPLMSAGRMVGWSRGG